MEFAQEGGEGPTPYEVLLHAAMVGDSTRFTRQDNIEETWRVCDPLLEKPPRVLPYKPGTWGPKAADRLVAELRRLARAVDRVMSPAKQKSAGKGQDPRGRQGGGNASERRDAVAVPADCGLRLPLQLPYRRAGGARRGDRLALRAAVRLAQHLRDAARPRSGLVPLRALRAQRAEQPDLRAGHQRPQHHLAHADRMGDGARCPDDRSHPARGRGHPAHARARRRGRSSHARANGALHGGLGRHGAALRAGLRLRAHTRRVVATGPAHRRRERSGGDGQAAQQHPAGGGSRSGAGAAHAPEGRAGVLLALLGGGARLAGGHRPGQRTHERDRELLAQLDLQGPHAGSPLQGGDPALGPRHQGAHLHADGRHRRRPDDLAAGDARWGAQLGLPVHLDAGTRPSRSRRCTT